MNIDNSYTVAVLTEIGKRVRVALSKATVTRIGRNGSEKIGNFARQSRVAGAVRRAEHVTRASWLYRWLTAEPDPDVVVIDLRETIFVGPLLDIVDWVIGPFAAHWSQSRSRSLFDRLSATFTDRPVQVVSLVALVAVLTNLVVSAGLGSPSPGDVGVRLVVLSLALAGTRVTASADELSGTRTFGLLSTLLSPPEPPESKENER